MRVRVVDFRAEPLDRALSHGQTETVTVDAVPEVEGTERGGRDAYDCLVCSASAYAADAHTDLPEIVIGPPDEGSGILDAGATDYVPASDGTVPWEIVAHRVERVVREEGLYTQVIESSPGGILVVDENWGLVSFNDEFLNLWNLSIDDDIEWDSDQLIERLLAQVANPDEVREEIAYYLEHPNEIRNGQIKLANGRELAHYAVPLRGGDGRVSFFRDVTDTVERQNQLERYETILEALGDPVYAVDADGEITFVNDAYAEQSGLPREELLGATVEEVREPSEIEKVQALIEDLLASEVRSEGTVEIERRMRKERTRLMENHIAILPPGEDDSYRGSAGVLRDITDRVERERTLEQYRSLVDAMTDPACIYDTDGRLALVNQTLAEWYDEPAEALVGRESPIIDYIRDNHEGDAFADLIAGDREELRGEYRADALERGEVVEYRLTRLMIDGECEGAVGVSRDISDRKARERELRETQTLLQTVVQNLPVGVIVEDGEGTVRVANGTFVEQFGLPSDWAALIGRDCRSVIEAVADNFERPDAFIETLHALDAECDDPVRYEEWELTGDRIIERDFIPYSLLGNPASLWIFREITNRKQHERELEEQNRQLEEFASFVSHDLRNPLNVAQGRLELAIEEVDSDHLDDVANAHDRMQALIDDLLVMAREGGTEVREHVELDTLFESCWKNVATEDADCQVEADHVIRADAARLRQLLENLIRNAVEHAGDNVTITIGDLEDGFFVEDDGSGIPESRREEIFEAGFTTAQSGTGLGLNIVEQVVEEHDWTIRISESDAGGARFEIRNVELS